MLASRAALLAAALPVLTAQACSLVSLDGLSGAPGPSDGSTGGPDVEAGGAAGYPGQVQADAPLAYWRFDGNTDGVALASSTRVRDHSGHGNDLIVAQRPGAAAGALRWSTEHHPDQPGAGSLVLQGGKELPCRIVFVHL